jgi:hypothetical protein
MKKGSFLGRLPLFALGCASTQGSLQPQPEALSGPLSQTSSTCAPIFSRQELALLGLLILLVASLLVIAFDQAKKKTVKKSKRKKK